MLLEKGEMEVSLCEVSALYATLLCDVPERAKAKLANRWRIS